METLNQHMHIPEPGPGKLKLNAMKIIIALILLAIAAVALVFVLAQTPNDVVKAQLLAIKTGDINKAYRLTSSDFQQGTDQHKFEEFINKYDVLKQNNSFVFNESKSEGTIGYVSGKVEDKEGNTATIEFQLAKENGNWSIQALRLSDFTTPSNPTAAVDKTGAKINDILISNIADAKGFVTVDKPTLPKSAKKIFATVKFNVPNTNVKISAMLINTKNGGKIGPSIGKVDQKGDAIKAFSFTSEKSTWPEGKYEITISLSSGATKTVRFEIK
jgi:type II secretory pathway pseudopilin PulG